jgi:hypothetical protein
MQSKSPLVPLGSCKSLTELLSAAATAKGKPGPSGTVYLHRSNGWSLSDEPQAVSSKDKRQALKRALVELIKADLPGPSADSRAQEAMKSILVNEQGQLQALTTDRLVEVHARIAREVPPVSAEAAAKLREGDAFVVRIMNGILTGRNSKEDCMQCVDLMKTHPELVGGALAVVQRRIEVLRREDSPADWIHLGAALTLLPRDSLDKINLSVEEVARIARLFKTGIGKGPVADRKSKAEKLRAQLFSPATVAKRLGKIDADVTSTLDRLAEIAASNAKAPADRVFEGKQPWTPASNEAPPSALPPDVLAFAEGLMSAAEAGAGPVVTAERERSLSVLVHRALDPGDDFAGAQSALERLVPVLHRSPADAALAVTMIEDEIDRIRSGIRSGNFVFNGGAKFQFTNMASVALLMVPHTAWEHVFLTAETVDDIASWHDPVSGARGKERQLKDQLRAKVEAFRSLFPDQEFNVAAAVARLRTNAARFERFLKTELAMDPRLFGVDRSILIELSEQADAMSGDDAGDRKARRVELPAAYEPARPESSSVEQPGAAVAHESSWSRPRGLAADSARAGPLQAASADAAASEEPKVSAKADRKFAAAAGVGEGARGVVSQPSLEPNLNLHQAVPRQAKRHTPHHDASKARWRSKRQRDLVGRKGKGDNHAAAVAALRQHRSAMAESARRSASASG